MLKQKKIDREIELKKFSEIVGEWINANALVNDNWMNTLKTYHNIKISEEETRRIYMLMMCLFIELSLARFEDLLQPREKTSFEKAVIEHIAYINGIIYGLKNDVKEETKKTMENALHGLLEVYRKNRIEQNLTIPQNYLAFLANPSHETKLSEDIWSQYLNFHIELFEKRNFRLQLSKLLDESPFL